MTEPAPTLGELALRLRNGNPDIWELFLAKLQEYHDDLAFKVVQAPVDEVCVAQGRAQSTWALLRIFKECAIEKKHTPLPQAPSRP